MTFQAVERLISVTLGFVVTNQAGKTNDWHQRSGIGGVGSSPKAWLSYQAKYSGPGEHKSCLSPGVVVQGGNLVRGIELESPELLLRNFLHFSKVKTRLFLMCGARLG